MTELQRVLTSAKASGLMLDGSIVHIWRATRFSLRLRSAFRIEHSRTILTTFEWAEYQNAVLFWLALPKPGLQPQWPAFTGFAPVDTRERKPPQVVRTLRGMERATA